MSDQPHLTIVPISRAEAVAFLSAHHRTHVGRPAGAKFYLGVADAAGAVKGVAIVGRPVARHLDDGWTLEAVRVCSDGTPNAGSALYAAAWRATSALGYRRLITYTQAGESGASLRGAGWRVIGERAPRAGWDTPSRPRVDTTAGVARTLWEAPV